MLTKSLVRLLLIALLFPCIAISGQIDCPAAVVCTRDRCERIWNIGKSDKWERVKIDEEKMKKWVDAHDGKGRVVAEFLSQHYRFVRMPELYEKFHSAMSRALSEVGTKAVTVAWTGDRGTGKSGDLMAGYLLDAFPQLGQSRFVFDEMYDMDPGVLGNKDDIIFIDDASYSGDQMKLSTKRLKKIRPNVKVSVVTAFITNQAIRELRSVGVDNIFYGELMPTIDEMMKENVDYETLRQNFLRMYLSEDRLKATLTFFEHKVADNISFLYAFSEGHVFDIVKRRRPEEKSKVPFIHKPKDPFYRIYD